MKKTKEYGTFILKYTVFFIKWILAAVLVGIIGGVVGVLFHFAVDYVTELRTEHKYILYFLPVGGIIIALLYKLFSSKGKLDTNRILESVKDDRNVPVVMVPLIFVSAVITHLFGGSAGREGAALQIGGGIGYNLGKLFKLDKNSLHIITMAGMSSVFSALFGTPLAAAVFSLEVIRVGALNYTGFLACMTASATSYYFSIMSGVAPVRFNNVEFPVLSPEILIKVIIFAVLCGILSFVFCTCIEKCEDLFDNLIHNCYMRAFIGGALIVCLTLIVGTRDYNGAGMDIIGKAVSGDARIYDFIFKIIFTAITISAGYKGGEIVPTLFIGATFGCALSGFLGMDAGVLAALGMISLFCGVVNCPVASIFLAVEIFGSEGLILFGIVCAVSYITSGHSGLYKSQNILYSKLTADFIDKK